jgi:hypothetical protein
LAKEYLAGKHGKSIPTDGSIEMHGKRVWFEIVIQRG